MTDLVVGFFILSCIFGCGFVAGAWWCAMNNGKAMGEGFRKAIREGLITKAEVDRLIMLIEED